VRKVKVAVLRMIFSLQCQRKQRCLLLAFLALS